MKAKIEEITKLQQEVADLRSELVNKPETEFQVQDLQETVDMLNKRLKQIETEKEDLKKELGIQLEKTMQSTASCQQAHTLISEHLENAQKHQAEIQKLTIALKASNDQCDVIKSQLITVEAKANDEKKEFVDAAEKWKIKQKSLESEIEQKISEVQLLTQAKSDVERELEELTHSWEDLTNQLYKAKAKLEVEKTDSDLQTGSSVFSLTDISTQFNPDTKDSTSQTAQPVLQDAVQQTTPLNISHALIQTDNTEMLENCSQTTAPRMVSEGTDTMMIKNVLSIPKYTQTMPTAVPQFLSFWKQQMEHNEQSQKSVPSTISFKKVIEDDVSMTIRGSVSTTTVEFEKKLIAAPLESGHILNERTGFNDGQYLSNGQDQIDSHSEKESNRYEMNSKIQFSEQDNSSIHATQFQAACNGLERKENSKKKVEIERPVMVSLTSSNNVKRRTSSPEDLKENRHKIIKICGNRVIIKNEIVNSDQDTTEQINETQASSNNRTEISESYEVQDMMKNDQILTSKQPQNRVTIKSSNLSQNHPFEHEQATVVENKNVNKSSHHRYTDEDHENRSLRENYDPNTISKSFLSSESIPAIPESVARMVTDNEGEGDARSTNTHTLDVVDDDTEYAVNKNRSQNELIKTRIEILAQILKRKNVLSENSMKEKALYENIVYEKAMADGTVLPVQISTNREENPMSPGPTNQAHFSNSRDETNVVRKTRANTFISEESVSLSQLKNRLLAVKREMAASSKSDKEAERSTASKFPKVTVGDKVITDINDEGSDNIPAGLISTKEEPPSPGVTTADTDLYDSFMEPSQFSDNPQNEPRYPDFALIKPEHVSTLGEHTDTGVEGKEATFSKAKTSTGRKLSLTKSLGNRASFSASVYAKPSGYPGAAAGTIDTLADGTRAQMWSSVQDERASNLLLDTGHAAQGTNSLQENVAKPQASDEANVTPCPATSPQSRTTSKLLSLTNLTISPPETIAKSHILNGNASSKLLELSNTPDLETSKLNSVSNLESSKLIQTSNTSVMETSKLNPVSNVESSNFLQLSNPNPETSKDNHRPNPTPHPSLSSYKVTHIPKKPKRRSSRKVLFPPNVASSPSYAQREKNFYKIALNFTKQNKEMNASSETSDGGKPKGILKDVQSLKSSKTIKSKSVTFPEVLEIHMQGLTPTSQPDIQSPLFTTSIPTPPTYTSLDLHVAEQSDEDILGSPGPEERDGEKEGMDDKVVTKDGDELSEKSGVREERSGEGCEEEEEKMDKRAEELSPDTIPDSQEHSLFEETESPAHCDDGVDAHSTEPVNQKIKLDVGPSLTSLSDTPLCKKRKTV